MDCFRKQFCLIFGNMEKIALVLFIPYFMDFLLPLRQGLKVEAFGKTSPDGSLEMPYDGIYDMAHLAIFVLKKIKRKVYERDVVVFILLIEVFLAAAALRFML